MENRILKEQLDKSGKKLRLNDRQRRSLAKSGKAIGWKLLQEYASIARPETIRGWIQDQQHNGRKHSKRKRDLPCPNQA